MVNSLPANAGDTGSIPGPRGSHMLRSDSASGPDLLKSTRSRVHAPQPGKTLPSEAVQQLPLAGTRKSPRAAMKTQKSQTQCF